MRVNDNSFSLKNKIKNDKTLFLFVCFKFILKVVSKYLFNNVSFIFRCLIIIYTIIISARVSYREELLDTLSRLKLIAPEYDEFDFISSLWPELDVLSPIPKADTTINYSIVSRHENQR